MKIAPAAATPPVTPTVQTDLNPAKQAKAAKPAVKGAEFGALVSDIAHARNAARKAARHGGDAPEAPAPVETPPPAGPTPEPGTGEAIDLNV